MPETLYVKWDTGYLNINKDQFFPCNLAKFKKLLKIIDLDWEHRDALREELKNYFQFMVEHCKITAKQKANDYVNADQRVHDLQRLVKERKKPSGVYLTKGEYEQAQTDLFKARTEAADLLSEHKINTANMKKFQRLLEEINKK